MLDLQNEQYQHGQPYADLYEGVQAFKKRYALHDVRALPRDSLAFRRPGEREQVQDLVKRFRDIPDDQQKQLPALLNSLAQLELLIGEFDAAQQDFDEVAGLVADHDERAEAHHNTYRAALERRDWPEALAALLRACTLAPDLYEPFPLARFEPKSILGAGAFGVSFLCTERGNGDTVVVKSLREDTLDRPIGLVLHEQQMLQDVEQPALIRLREQGYADPNQTRPYLVFEHFEGITLAEYVRRHGPLSPEDALQVLWPIARALQAIHSRGVLHRCLSPWNVLVRPLEVLPSPSPYLSNEEPELEEPEDSEEPVEPWLLEELDEPDDEPFNEEWEDEFDDEEIHEDLDDELAEEYAENIDEENEDENDEEELAEEDVVAREVMESLPIPAVPVIARWQVRLIEAAMSVKRVVLHAAASNPAARAQTGLGRSVTRGLPYAPSEVVGRPKGLVWVGPHSDIYSFGKLCCFTLTGSPELKPRTPVTDDVPPPDFKSEWLQILSDCSAWLINSRPSHVGAILHRLSNLPGASAIVDAVENFSTQQMMAIYTAQLQRNTEDVRAYAGRAGLHVQRSDLDAALADFSEALKRRPGDAHLLRRRGQVYLDRGDLDAAITDFSRAVDLEPRNLDGWSLRAGAYSRKGMHNEAIADYSEVVRQSPRDDVAYFSRGNEYYSKGAWSEAIADYTTVIRLAPHHLWAFGNRGKARTHLGDHEQAVADFAQLLRLEPENSRARKDRGVSLLALGRYEEAIAEFTRGIEHDASAGLYIERGLARAEHGEHEEAIEDFTRAHDLDPESPWAIMYRGNSHCDQGNLDAALADLSEAVRLGPGLASAWYNRANVLAKKGESEQALSDYSKSLECDPEYTASWFNRGNAYADRDDHQRAIADYTKVLELDPRDIAALNNRGNSYGAQGDLDAALADFNEALRLSPSDIVALFNRGNTYSRLGAEDAAFADYSEVIRLSPRHARAYNYRGNLHLDRGEIDRALADYTNAIEANSAYASAWRNRAGANRDKGDLDAALADYTKAIELAPQDETLLLDRAVLHTRRGDLDAALTDYTMALTFNPRLLPAYHSRARLYARRGDHVAALADNEAALLIEPDDSRTLNNLAWLWATCPKEGLRNPEKAVEAAIKACERTDWKEAGYLDTLAVAYAAKGLFEEAVKWQEKALELCTEEEKVDYRSRLELYRTGQPYLEG